MVDPQWIGHLAQEVASGECPIPYHLLLTLLVNWGWGVGGICIVWSILHACICFSGCYFEDINVQYSGHC